MLTPIPDAFAFADEWEECGSLPPEVLRNFSCRVLNEGAEFALTLGRSRFLGAAAAILRSASGERLIREFSQDFDGGVTAVAETGPSLVVKDSDGQSCLHGTLSDLVNARSAEYFLLIAPGPSLFLVPATSVGLRREAARNEGLRSAGLAHLHFEGCVPTASCLLACGPAVEAAVRSWREFDTRLQSAALVGMCEAAISDISRYTHQRRFERGVLATKQVVRHRMADLTADLGLARASLGRNIDVDELALFLQDVARRLIDGALQLFGGSGYMAANWITRSFRDVQSLHLLFDAGRQTVDRVVECGAKLPENSSDFRHRARAFVEENVSPYLQEWESKRTLPSAIFRAFGESGLLGHMLPSPDNKRQDGLWNSIAMVEELMRRRAGSVAVSVLLPSTTICPLLMQRACAELRNRLLPGILTGATPASLAVTEPTGGSDLLQAVETSAVAEGEYWVLSGEKAYITNAPIASLAIVLARTAANRGPLSMSLIAVPMESAGVTVVERHEKLGLHASPTGRIRFDRVRVPKNNTVGRPNLGFVYFTEAISEERLLIAAGATAFAASCLDETESRLRNAGLWRDSLVRREIASLRARLSASRAFIESVVDRIVRGERMIAECCAAKFAVCESAQQAIERCARLLDYFACRGHNLDRAMSDARVLSIFAGSSETMRDIYSDHLIRETLAKRNAP